MEIECRSTQVRKFPRMQPTALSLAQAGGEIMLACVVLRLNSLSVSRPERSVLAAYGSKAPQRSVAAPALSSLLHERQLIYPSRNHRLY